MSWKKEVVTRAFRKKFGLKNMILDNCCNFECITFSKRDGSLVVSFVYPNVTAKGISLRYMVIKRYSSEKDKVEELILFDDNIQMESYHWPVTELNVDFDSSVHLFDYEWRDIEENLKFMHELDMDKSINGFEILCRALSNLNITLSTVNSCKVAGLEIRIEKFILMSRLIKTIVLIMLGLELRISLVLPKLKLTKRVTDIRFLFRVSEILL